LCNIGYGKLYNKKLKAGVRMSKWMEKFNHWKFDKKMTLFISFSIVITTMVILIVSASA